ncbi:TetR/AcrR family transcriptional regulator [Gynuella sunshinyii]|uniref:Transcriptional regulator n=1 Tax=Gynuella sunshinyii YC6258 TaxID=1445510 RepID=A0A0C5VQW8_9GAMM|nr:TetR/AcrR family transcriptional regulator [Gynuella sunshinyii]AJQ95783.1 transcriptional regulator [Gynuella sunshinyii YC6258]DAC80054.1 TPA_exp: TetR/AcrR family transcriptional regulator [Gynuella sunshinyii YC6258]
MTQQDTASRILDTAQELFATHGFTETSLRSITSHAGVNLAAVNYHFGSKKELIQAVFARFLNPFCQLLDRELDVLTTENDGQAQLEQVLAVLAKTMLVGVHDSSSGNRLSLFLKLLGLAYTQSQGHLKKFLRTNYHHTYKRFISAIQLSRPDISPNDLFWRIHFAIGATIFTLSNIETLRAMALNDTRVDNHISQIVQMLLPFIVAGVDHE